MEKKIDFDVYGHCVVCHENLMVEQAIDGEVIKRFVGKQTHTDFVLSDGSIMRVMICKPCLKALKEEDHEEIMNCVIRGWDVETDLLIANKRKGWDKQKKDAYMEKYSKLSIAFKDDGLSEDLRKHKYKKYIKDKEQR